MNGAMDTAYVYGASAGTGSGRLSLNRFDGSTGYYLYDPRGSVTGITNEEGQVYQSYRYSAFGEVTFGAPRYENEYTYNGESYNPNIHCQYLRARYYDVVKAAFVTEDFYPQDMWALWNVKEPLTLNRYSYCAGNPLYYVDRNGHVVNVVAGFVVGTIGGFIVGTVTEAGKLIGQGKDYDWQAGLINIANTTTAGAVGGTVFGATLNPALAATAAGGTYGGLNELTGSVMRGDGVLQTVENTARGTAVGSVAGCVGGIMGMGTAGYMAASGAPVLIQVAASGAAGGISSGATHRALTGKDTTPEAVAMDGVYGSLSALTFYGTGLAYERVTAPKLPNTYIRDRLAAVEEMNRSEGCDGSTDFNSQSPMFSEDWHRYFNNIYGQDNVIWESVSMQDIIDMPSRITDFSPQQIAEIAQTNGWSVASLGQGSLEGVPYEQGGGLSIHAPNGGSEYIQYHPGGGHHGDLPYFKISSGPNGIVRYFIGGNEK